MQFYPEDAGGSMNQLWHGRKWMEDCADDLLTPTAKVGNEIYYVNELLLRRDGKYFVPKRFFLRVDQGQPKADPKLWALGHEAIFLEVSSPLTCWKLRSLLLFNLHRERL